MKFAFCLYKYFPYSGLSRDFMRILMECSARGHEIEVFASEWQGDRPEGIKVHVLPSWRWMNHSQNAVFHKKMNARIKQKNYDAIVGFNKMPGLDIYYGADYCYVGRAVPRYNALYRLTPRYRHFCHFEKAVFGAPFNTQILSLSEVEKVMYQQFYGTPDNRFHLLPPTLSKNRRVPQCEGHIGKRIRDEFGILAHQKLVLFIGSGYKTKGLDRAIRALASMPQPLRSETRLLVVGQDKVKPYLRLAGRLGISHNIEFLGGRTDIPELLCAGDILLHPAYNEIAGAVLLEAITAGLPVITTDVCGYASHVHEAQAGVVLSSPFRQQELNEQLTSILSSGIPRSWSDNGLAYGNNPILYTMPEKAVEIIDRCTFENKTRKASALSTSSFFYVRSGLESGVLSEGEIDNIMELKGELYREAPGRRTVRFEHGGRKYFLKVHTGVGWQEILKNLIYFRLPVLGATNEWHGIHHLHRLGVDTLSIVAYANKGKNPAHLKSFIVTEELPASYNLEEFCQDWEISPPSKPDEIRFKRWLIRKLAEIARTIHSGGANHRDFYLCHFLLSLEDDSVPPKPETSKISLIDLHRMQIRKKTPVRWLVKDISGLYYSSMNIGLTKRDLFRFMQIYRDKPLREILKYEHIFWRRVAAKASSQYSRERQKTRHRMAQQNQTAIAR